jgi:enoyl-CoA hydratase/carnithine racemase
VPRLHIEVLSVDGIAEVRLSGEPLTTIEARELADVFDDLAEDGTTRVAVLTSRGEDFCVGAAGDLIPLASGVDPPRSIAASPMPVIAALTGATASVGLEIALAADLRLVDAAGTFALPDLAIGRLPSWGGTQRLPRVAGRAAAARMLLAGETFDAAEAARCGLVHQVTDGDVREAALAMAAQLAQLAPLALRLTKEALARGPELPMRHALELEGDLNHLLQTTADRAEGLDAFFAKRPPRFEGR